MDQKIKVLVIDTGKENVATEKFEFPVKERELAHTTVLSVMNRMGKSSHALVKIGERYFAYDHTAKRGPSEKLKPSAISYHPFMSELV